MSKKYHNIRFQQYINKAKKIMNSEHLSITESKNPPKDVDLSVIRAIAPSIPSKIPVRNTKIPKKIRFLNKINEIQLNIAKKSIIVVARFGVTPN